MKHFIAMMAILSFLIAACAPTSTPAAALPKSATTPSPEPKPINTTTAPAASTATAPVVQLRSNSGEHCWRLSSKH